MLARGNASAIATSNAHHSTRTANSGPSNSRYSGSAAEIANITPAPSSNDVRRSLRAAGLRSAS